MPDLSFVACWNLCKHKRLFGSSICRGSADSRSQVSTLAAFLSKLIISSFGFRNLLSVFSDQDRMETRGAMKKNPIYSSYYEQIIVDNKGKMGRDV